MGVQIDSFGEVKVVRLTERRMTFSLLHDFSSQISQQVETGTRKLLIDLSRVSYLDSTCFGCLMDVYWLMSRRSGTVKLLGLQERVETVAKMTGVTRRMQAFRHEKEALESFT
jgi:anti-sigma B factor antagonist